MPKIIAKPAGPAYKRAFEQKDFRGYFTWNDRLSDRIGGSLYHACHEDEFDTFMDDGELGLRSTYDIMLPGQPSAWTADGVWCGLNNFGALGNFYGPCLLSFPVSVLGGRQFMVFRRNDGRDRVFFLQHEDPLPIFSFLDKSKRIPKRIVEPCAYFSKCRGEYSLKSGTIYDIVLTEPLSLDECQVYGTNHPRCIASKCDSSAPPVSRSAVHRAAMTQARRIILRSPEMKKLRKTVPSLRIQDVLPD